MSSFLVKSMVGCTCLALMAEGSCQTVSCSDTLESCVCEGHTLDGDLKSSSGQLQGMALAGTLCCLPGGPCLYPDHDAACASVYSSVSN